MGQNSNMPQTRSWSQTMESQTHPWSIVHLDTNKSILIFVWHRCGVYTLIATNITCTLFYSNFPAIVPTSIELTLSFLVAYKLDSKVKVCIFSLLAHSVILFTSNI